eukprot:TRINITY_DN1569_c0_g1_i4.p1 TRINITY_DN1569_c0_g1~~TRINITY_DN1569_c0_g1_i4.p1  ORF type:complete len:297 (+),score=44.28 TRINITY_DN1569_c0_g1_i4:60-950(+)
MDLSLDDVISNKQRIGKNSLNSIRGRGRGRGSVRIGQKDYKTLTIKKSKLGGVDLSRRTLRSDNMEQLVVSSSTPGKRYFSNDSSFQSNTRGYKRKSLPTQSTQSSMYNRLGNRSRSGEEEGSNITQWKRGAGSARRNRGSVVNLNNTVPRVGSSTRGFKGLASNSKKVKGFVQEYLRSPGNTGSRENSYSTGRGLRSTRGGRVGGRNKDNQGRYSESFVPEEDEANIQVTFSNPKAAPNRSGRHTDIKRSNKQTSYSTGALSNPGEHLVISVQNETARVTLPKFCIPSPILFYPT